MRKPLQARDEGVEALINSLAPRQGHIVIPYKWAERGQIIFRNTGDIRFLIETANSTLDISNLKEVHFLVRFGQALGRWMDRLVSTGFNKKILFDLREDLGNIRFYHILNPAIPSRGKTLPHWDYLADMEDFADPNVLAAYAFSQQLTLNGFDGLKRCRTDTCGKFFIGRPNAKWCSAKCGSKHRVNQKRKRDRNV